MQELMKEKTNIMRINKAKSWFSDETNRNDRPGNIHEREKKSKNKQY